jgi:hypothetical protein
MPVSLYRLTITRSDGGSVSWIPGSQAEVDLAEAIVARATAKGVGLFASTTKVQAAIREAVQESLHGLKAGIDFTAGL